jgi:hypothetical protein
VVGSLNPGSFKSARDMPRSDDRKTKSPGLALLEYLLGLDCEADGYFGRAVENLKEMAADEATELALGPRPGGQFNAAVARMTFGTSDV